MTQEPFAINDEDFIKWYWTLEDGERNLARLAAVHRVMGLRAIVQKIIDGDGTQQPTGIIKKSDYD